MSNTITQINLEELGIKTNKEVLRNLDYEKLYELELDPTLTGFDKGVLTDLGAVAVDTGKFTGRSPKDKYIVKESSSESNIWWASEGSDNKPISPEVWNDLKALSLKQLSNKKLYIMDGFCGANVDTRLSVRLITEVAWQAHFFKNMFIRPNEEELQNFKPDWTIFNACKTTDKENYKKHGLRSEVFVCFNIAERQTVIGGSWYGGEMKKGIFSIMNYFLPLKGIGAFHCSANQGENGDTALFFGLSGTGKTTLSTDPKRKLIGDDEHGWDDEGIFNFEGGCYAKTIKLSSENEPDIYKAIKKDALLENVVVDENGKVDFNSDEKTQNTRVSYPIYHIDNIVKPVSKGKHAKYVIFLTCDAYGVLPPVSKLTPEQAMYQYLSGYTAKVAGTELGVNEPVATFSACFGHPFLLLHPTKYADILGEKINKYGSKAFLVNTGWTGGSYGVGKRMDLPSTRRIIDAILSGELDNAETETMPIFGLEIPKQISGVDARILNPKNSWSDKDAFDKTAILLANKFKENFKKFVIDEQGEILEKFGPKI